MSRLSLAFRSFFGLLFSGKLPEDVMHALNLTRRLAAMAPPQAKAVSSAQPADGAVQILAYMQQEARLIDFLQEDIAPYTDDQIGAAVRDVHKNCRAVLERYLKLAPVIDGVEGASTRVASLGVDSADASVLRIVGNVPAGVKVEAGILRHRGWKAEKVQLPGVKAGATILAPAEIEVE